ncbi:MAG: hypothetical protein H6845_01130 [Alphaproteobacteria bacterium]|nr:MAG: hypothetical protein H6845_01130 [Alphaproteobacteria bacterium]
MVMKPALFERISTNPKHTYANIQELYESIRYEVGCIIDKQSIMYDGVRLYDIMPNSEYDREKFRTMISKIRDAILHYEPRLLFPKISVSKVTQSSIQFSISGKVQFYDEIYPIVLLNSKYII